MPSNINLPTTQSFYYYVLLIMESQMFYFQKPENTSPVQASAQATGYDLYSTYDYIAHLCDK